jgi:peptidoglycan/LPS O-acetylase OafA/YrhL
MHWGAYEICSVISGAMLLGYAIWGHDKGKVLAACALGGLGFIAYGFYVARQTSGTFYFPVWIFILPAIGLLYIIVSVIEYARGEGTTDAKQDGSSSEAMSPNGEDSDDGSAVNR